MTEKDAPIVSVSGLSKRFDLTGRMLGRLLIRGSQATVRAVDNVSFDIAPATTFALVGESGCGKSTIARCLAGILKPSAGEIRFLGKDITSPRQLTSVRGNLQMVFQDPYASLNPRWRVNRIVAEPIVTHGLGGSRSEIDARVSSLLRQVGLSPEDGRRYPHQFSGGQRQRISIARAIATNPQFLICDEPTSALDVSVQAQVLNLLKRLQRDLGLTYLLISHNLAVVAHMADRIGVMYLGRLVETGPTREVLSSPRHPYTRLLLDAVPEISGAKTSPPAVRGEAPSAVAPPAGCAFHPRCPLASDRCRSEIPQQRTIGGVVVACHEATAGEKSSNRAD